MYNRFALYFNNKFKDAPIIIYNTTLDIEDDFIKSIRLGLNHFYIFTICINMMSCGIIPTGFYVDTT